MIIRFAIEAAALRGTCRAGSLFAGLAVQAAALRAKAAWALSESPGGRLGVQESGTFGQRPTYGLGMRHFCAGLALVALACTVAARGEATGSCASGLEAPLHDRGALAVDSFATGVTVVGTDGTTLKVTCTNASDPHAVRFHLTGDPGHQQLMLRSDHHQDNLQIRIEVPHRSSLRLHMNAGEVTVNNVEGNKDIDLYAGQINIAAGDTSDYSSVHASVTIGEVKASAWGVDKGGFFRSFTRNTANGEYKIYAHVLTGEIDLK